MALLSESRSIYSGPIRRSVDRGERLGLDNTKAITGLGTQVGSIEEQVDVLESQIVTLQSQVSGLTSSVGTLQGQVTTLQGQVGALNTTVASQTTAINERAMGVMAIRGLAFSGDLVPTAGTNLSGTLACSTLTGHRYRVVLFLTMIYGGSLNVALHVNGSNTGAGVFMDGNIAEWSSSRAEWFIDGYGTGANFDAIVVDRDKTPHVYGIGGSWFYVEHLGPAR